MGVTTLLILSHLPLHQLVLDGLAAVALVAKRVWVGFLLTPEHYQLLLDPADGDHQYADYHVVRGGHTAVGLVTGFATLEPSPQLSRPRGPNRTQRQDHETRVAFDAPKSSPYRPVHVGTKVPSVRRSCSAVSEVAERSQPQDTTQASTSEELTKEFPTSHHVP